MFSYDLIANVYVCAFAASRGIQLSHHGRSLSAKSSPSHPHKHSRYNRRHEVYQEKHTNGSRLSSKEYLDIQNTDSQYLAATKDQSDNRWSEPDEIDTASTSNESPLVNRLRRSSSYSKQYCRQSGGNRIRRSTRQSSRHSSRRSKSDANSWHVKAADKVLKEAEAYDLTASDVASYATALLEQHIQTIKDEELVLDWGDTQDIVEEQKILVQVKFTSVVRKCKN